MSLKVSVQDLFGIWDSVQDKIQDRLPLTELNIRLLGRSTRSIGSLNVDICRFDGLATGSDQISHNILGDSILNIFVLKCDDVDAYRNHARQMIREWYNMVVARPGQQWLIVQVIANEPEFGSSGIARSTGNKFLNMRSSVFDKIRSDFNGSSKRDHCAQLRLGDGQVEMTEALDTLLSKMKELIETGLIERLQDVEQYISKTKSSLDSSGRTFSTFFVQQESLAQTLFSLTLLEDALRHYDELEASFEQALNRDQLESFGSVTELGQIDLTSPILDVNRKPYGQLILEGTITTFDLRIYLFSRQVSIMVADAQFTALLTRGLQFLSSMSQALEECRLSHPFFIESWIFTTAGAILAMIPAQYYTQSTAAAKGDLLSMQRTALISLRRTLVSEDPNVVTSDDVNLAYPYKTVQLGEILASQEGYHDHLRKLNETILIDYKYAERVYGTLLISLAIAQDKYSSEDYAGAARIYEGVVDFASEQSVRVLNASHLNCYLDCLSRIDQVEKLVKTCFFLLVSGKSPSIKEHLVSILDNQCDRLEMPFIASLASCAIVTIDQFARTHEHEHGLQINLSISWLLPLSTRTKKVRLNLANESGQSWLFYSNDQNLAIGESLIKVISHDYFAGDFRPTTVTLEWGKISLSQALSRKASRSLSLTASEQPVSLSLRRQRIMHLDRPRQVELQICVGDFDLAECTIGLQPLSTDFTVDLSDVRTIRHNAPAQETLTTNKVLAIGRLSRGTQVCLELPYTATQTISNAVVIVRLEYITNHLKCSFNETISSPISLPLAVNVQDFFREHCLFSKFQMLCIDPDPIRLISCRLISSGSYIVNKSEIYDSRLMLPENPYTQIHKIKPIKDTPYEPMRLVLRYRQIIDEIRAALEQYMVDLFSKLSISSITKGILLKYFVTDLSGVSVDRSARSNYIVSLLPSEYDWSALQSKIEPNDRKPVASILVMLNEAKGVSLSSKESQSLDYYIDIPVEIPANIIIHTVSIALESSTMKVGSSTSAILTIQNSDIWSRAPVADEEFSYTIEIDENVWILVGSYSGTFNLKGVLHARFCLVPLKAGALLYPSVEIQSSSGKLLSEIHLVSANSEVHVDEHDIERTIQL